MSTQPNPKFTIDVLRLLKSSQMQHGLRHRDYTRYRRYCTARLKRLYKALKFTHGLGMYTPRVISESTITDVRFLHLVIYSAERAWSYGMEKRQLPGGPNARQQIYLTGRLRKAAKWAKLFSELCSIKCDSRTTLEAEAYASYMKGTLLFEQDRNWDAALANFKSARAVYEELGKYGDVETQVLCHERVDELEPSIRYCMHKLGRSNLQTSELLHIGDMEGPSLDQFKAKLEAVIEETRSQQAASLTEFHLCGRRFPIINAKTRVSILKAQELQRALSDPSAESLHMEKKLAMIEKIFTAYHEAKNYIKNDLATAGDTGTLKDDLYGLDKAITIALEQFIVERNQLLVDIGIQKGAKTEELVSIYDRLLQSMADLTDLLSSGRDQNTEEVAFFEECRLKCSTFRAERCSYLAKSYSVGGKRAEAYSLYSLARSIADEALVDLQKLGNSNEMMYKRLKMVSDQCRVNICIEHSKGILEDVKVEETLAKNISTLSLDASNKQGRRFLRDKLDVFESAVVYNTKGKGRTKGSGNEVEIMEFPPPLKPIPCTPIVLDLAFNFIEFPSLEHRIRKEKKGFISKLWW